MTPKQKAKELIETLLPYCTYDKEGLVYPVAKQAATEVAEEILNEFPQGFAGNFEERRQQWWKKVKQEIINYKL